MTRLITTKQIVHAMLVAGLACGWPIADALAHAHLAKATPAVDATVATAPTSISLEFNEAIEPKFSGAVVTGADKVVVKTGPSAIEAGHKKVLLVPITEALKPGTYTVEWHALSGDGHTVKGSYAFTLTP